MEETELNLDPKDEVAIETTDNPLEPLLAGKPGPLPVRTPAPMPTDITIEHVIWKAMDLGLTPEALQKLLDVQERMENRAAEKAYNEAMSKFQGMVGIIEKKTEAKDKNTGKVYFKYAALEDIHPIIQEPLKKCKLSYKHDSKVIKKQEGQELSVEIICTVTHISGHKDTSTFESPVEGSSMMNKIQKMQSTITQGKRGSLMMVLGLVAAGEDDSGMGSGDAAGDVISTDQVAELMKMIGDNEGGLLDSLCTIYKIDALSELPVAQFIQCKNKIVKYKQNLKEQAHSEKP